MKYVAIFMPDLLYMDDKVGDFHFIWNPQTRMFQQRCDFDTTYPPRVILEGSEKQNLNHGKEATNYNR